MVESSAILGIAGGRWGNYPVSGPSPNHGPISGTELVPPFPRKLVDRIRTGQYVEMRDLLTDNISLLQQMDTFTSQYACIPALPGALKPRLRDVASLPSWMYCFLAYIAIRCTDPYAAPGMWHKHA